MQDEGASLFDAKLHQIDITILLLCESNEAKTIALLAAEKFDASSFSGIQRKFQHY